MSLTSLVLVRHGQTDWNLQGRIQGRSDVPLNDVGRAQALDAGLRLVADRYDAIVSSPLIRAAETARIIGEQIGIAEVELLDALVERDYGAAEGMTGSEIEAAFGPDRIVPGRERRSAVVARVRPALIELAERRPDQSIIVVSHGGVIGSLVRDATAYAWPEPGSAIANGSAHRFAFRRGAVELVEFNGQLWTAQSPAAH